MTKGLTKREAFYKMKIRIVIDNTKKGKRND